MKKIIAMLLALCACGQSAGDPSDSAAPSDDAVSDLAMACLWSGFYAYHLCPPDRA